MVSLLPSTDPTTRATCRMSWIAHHRTQILAAMPLLLFIAYLVVLVSRLSDFYWTVILSNSDSTMYMLLSTTLAHGAYGTVYLSYDPWYSTILIDVLTYHLPNHQAIWALWPIVTYIAAVGALAWIIWRIMSPFAALMTTLLCLAMTPPMLWPTMAQAYHELSVVNAMLLVVFFVALVSIGSRLTWTLALCGLGLAVITGINAASDPLLLVIGIPPFLGVSLLLLACWHDLAIARLCAYCFAIGALAFVVMLVTNVIALRLHLEYISPLIHLVGPNQVPHQLKLAGGIVWALVGGSWQYVATNPGRNELLVGIATVGVLLVSAELLIAMAVRGYAISIPANVSSTSMDSPQYRARVAYGIIWVAIASANMAALALTDFVYNLTQLRYATILPVAAAALLPLLFYSYPQPLGRPTPVRDVLFATLVIGVMALRIGTWLPLSTQQTPAPIDTRMLVTYLESQHVSYGYADYWESNSTTWATGGAITLRAAYSCSAKGQLCALKFADASAWYQPHSGWTAIVVDPRFLLTATPSVYGPPREIRQIGPMTVYVYDHPLARVPFKGY